MSMPPGIAFIIKLAGGIFMVCSLSELKDKEVVDIRTGERLGTVDDVRFDTVTSMVTGLVIYGRRGFFGTLGGDDTEIPCSAIKVIGTDIILVDHHELTFSTNIGRNSFKSLFE